MNEKTKGDKLMSDALTKEHVENFKTWLAKARFEADLVTAGEYCKIIRISKNYLYKSIEEGENLGWPNSHLVYKPFSNQKVGGKWLFSLWELYKWSKDIEAD